MGPGEHSRRALAMVPGGGIGPPAPPSSVATAAQQTGSSEEVEHGQ
jgi:hypothetical protein